MTDYKINMVVKQREKNFWRKVDDLHGLEPEEASLIIDCKYSSFNKIKRKRLFEVLGDAFDETAETIDYLLNGKKTKK